MKYSDDLAPQTKVDQSFDGYDEIKSVSSKWMWKAQVYEVSDLRGGGDCFNFVVGIIVTRWRTASLLVAATNVDVSVGLLVSLVAYLARCVVWLEH